MHYVCFECRFTCPFKHTILSFNNRENISIALSPLELCSMTMGTSESLSRSLPYGMFAGVKIDLRGMRERMERIL